MRIDTELIEKSVDRVFPPGCSAAWRPREVPPDCRFWVIPGRDGPRWIVPQDPRFGWPGLKQWRPYDRLSRGKWALLMAAYRAGQLGLVPGVVPLGVAGAHTADWSVVGWNGDLAPVPVIYIGTPGPTQKAVATLVEQNSHEPTAVAKAPLGARAATRILREADILGRLAVEKPGIAPRSLFIDRERGVTLQEVVLGRLSGRRLTEAHLRWLVNMQTVGEETSLRAHVVRLREPMSRLNAVDEGVKELVEETLETISDPTPLPAVWVHGDFAPWNLTWRNDKELGALDWEMAEPGGLPLQDLFHFVYVQGYLFRSQPSTKNFVRDGGHVSNYCKLTGISAHIWRKLLLFHLSACWVQRCNEGDRALADYFARQLVRVHSEAI